MCFSSSNRLKVPDLQLADHMQHTRLIFEVLCPISFPKESALHPVSHCHVLNLFFLADGTNHLNYLSQWNRMQVCHLLSRISAFESKLRLWEFHLRKNNLSNFSWLSTFFLRYRPHCLQFTGDRRSEFAKGFADMKSEFSIRLLMFPMKKKYHYNCR